MGMAKFNQLLNESLQTFKQNKSSADLEFVKLDIQSKANQILNKHNKIFMAYSGGADSEIMRNLFEELNLMSNKITLIYYDTGIDYKATKDFIKEKIEGGANIIIQKPYKPVVIAVKETGQPFISKRVSEMLERLQRHNFNIEMDGFKEYPELIKLYPKCKSAIQWWTNFSGGKYDTIENQKRYDKPQKSMVNIARNKLLKEFLIKYGLPFKVSAKCCHYSKKMTAHKFEKENNFDLNIQGVRKAEGGARSIAYKNCYTEKSDISVYRPIFWVTNKLIEEYKKERNIKFSDCYEKYGLKRTGCAGCPFGKNLEQEREVLKIYEPQLSKAVENIFKDTFLWTRKYKKFKNGDLTNK